jgi:hypothetical protein
MKVLIEVEYDEQQHTIGGLLAGLSARGGIHSAIHLPEGVVAGSNLDRTGKVPVRRMDVRAGDYVVFTYRGHRFEGEAYEYDNAVYMGGWSVKNPSVRIQFVEAWRGKPALPTEVGTVIKGRVMSGGLSKEVTLMRTNHSRASTWISSEMISSRTYWSDDEITDWRLA